MIKNVDFVFLICLGFISVLFSQDTLRYGKFGKITIYRESAQPAQVILFVSGDGGWNLGVVDMARNLASLDALVAGIDINRYIRSLENDTEECGYPAGDFELLSKFIQQQYDYQSYKIPILVGYSSGATLVYATLVQAPSTTFRGGISLGFCPDLSVTKPLCRGNGLQWKIPPKGKGYVFLPSTLLQVPWFVLQGNIDRVCAPDLTEKFVRQTSHAKFIMLPGVGHGFSVEKNWMPQFKDAFKQLIQSMPQDSFPSSSASLGDLPLIEVTPDHSRGNVMVLHLTGDGGWGVTDKDISQALADSGMPVVALNSLKYFWKKRTPAETAADVERILDHFTKIWNKPNIILSGYSFGADVMPFVINRLPENMRSRIKLVVLLGASHYADFKFHLTDWLGGADHTTNYPVGPELEKLREMNILCFFGAKDDDVLCPDLQPGLVRSIQLPGGHRIGSHTRIIVHQIFESLHQNK